MEWHICQDLWVVRIQEKLPLRTGRIMNYTLFFVPLPPLPLIFIIRKFALVVRVSVFRARNSFVTLAAAAQKSAREIQPMSQSACDTK